MGASAVWLATVLALLILAVAPALLLAVRGSSVQRLVGLQLLSACGVMASIGLSAAVGQSSYLIVPLVLAILASTGTLVFTRLLRRGIDEGEDEEQAVSER